MNHPSLAGGDLKIQPIPLETQNEIDFDGGSVFLVVFSRRKPSRTCLADIEQYFHQPPPQFLDLGARGVLDFGMPFEGRQLPLLPPAEADPSRTPITAF